MIVSGRGVLEGAGGSGRGVRTRERWWITYVIGTNGEAGNKGGLVRWCG